MKPAILLVVGYLVIAAGCTPAQLAAVRNVADLADRVCVEGEDWSTCIEKCETEAARGAHR